MPALQPVKFRSFIEISEMRMTDYGTVLELLRATPGVTVRTADSYQAIERYLARNPGLSFVAKEKAQLVGCIMCGHDGRRAYLQHLAVVSTHRYAGLGRKLVQCCLEAVKQVGIEKVHIDVLAENLAAQAFWRHLGWNQRDDLLRYSCIISKDMNA